jgi:hypothetical protein
MESSIMIHILYVSIYSKKEKRGSRKENFGCRKLLDLRKGAKINGTDSAVRSDESKLRWCTL